MSLLIGGRPRLALPFPVPNPRKMSDYEENTVLDPTSSQQREVKWLGNYPGIPEDFDLNKITHPFSPISFDSTNYLNNLELVEKYADPEGLADAHRLYHYAYDTVIDTNTSVMQAHNYLTKGSEEHQEAADSLNAQIIQRVDERDSLNEDLKDKEKIFSAQCKTAGVSSTMDEHALGSAVDKKLGLTPLSKPRFQSWTGDIIGYLLCLVFGPLVGIAIEVVLRLARIGQIVKDPFNVRNLVFSCVGILLVVVAGKLWEECIRVYLGPKRSEARRMLPLFFSGALFLTCCVAGCEIFALYMYNISNQLAMQIANPNAPTTPVVVYLFIGAFGLGSILYKICQSFLKYCEKIDINKHLALRGAKMVDKPELQKLFSTLDEHSEIKKRKIPAVSAEIKKLCNQKTAIPRPHIGIVTYLRMWLLHNHAVKSKKRLIASLKTAYAEE